MKKIYNAAIYDDYSNNKNTNPLLFSLTKTPFKSKNIHLYYCSEININENSPVYLKLKEKINKNKIYQMYNCNFNASDLLYNNQFPITLFMLENNVIDDNFEDSSLVKKILSITKTETPLPIEIKYIHYLQENSSSHGTRYEVSLHTIIIENINDLKKIKNTIEENIIEKHDRLYSTVRESRILSINNILSDNILSYLNNLERKVKPLQGFKMNNFNVFTNEVEKIHKELKENDLIKNNSMKIKF